MKPVIDWNKAPSGATHVGSQHREDMIVWYQFFEVSNTWYFWYSENGILDTCGWKPVFGIPLHLPLFQRDDYIAPPIERNLSIVDQLMVELELPSYQGFRELLDKLVELGHLRQ